MHKQPLKSFLNYSLAVIFLFCQSFSLVLAVQDDTNVSVSVNQSRLELEDALIAGIAGGCGLIATTTAVALFYRPLGFALNASFKFGKDESNVAAGLLIGASSFLLSTGVSYIAIKRLIKDFDNKKREEKREETFRKFKDLLKELNAELSQAASHLKLDTSGEDFQKSTGLEVAFKH